MRSQGRNAIIRFALVTAVLISGCHSGGEKEVHYLSDADLSYYKNTASTISHAAICTEQSPQVAISSAPRTVNSREKDDIWDMSLQECIQIALKNSRIIKSAGQFQSAQNSLFTAGERVNSVYDPAIQQSGVLFGSLGTEAALSAFDVDFASSMFWGRNESVQNRIFKGVPGGTATSETAAFNTSLSKQMGYGASVGLSHQMNYLGSNADGLLFPSTYTGNIGIDYRQPLLAGSGSEFVRTAGPRTGFGAITGVSQGVTIARINNDISIADFESTVRALVRDVETTYLDLYLAYRNYDTATKSRNSALQTWRVAHITRENGGARRGFKNWQEAQARDRFFETDAQKLNARSEIYSQETRLRNLVQLPVNDGRIIRPVDEPVIAQIDPDWYQSLAEGLTERVELRRQKWIVKSLQLQLSAAKNAARPQLDFVANYTVNGFGNRLIGQSDKDPLGTPQGLDNAYESFTQGNQTGWTAGLDFSVPLGLRRSKTQVRNIELRLAKSQKVLQAQELEIAHELAAAFQELARSYRAAVMNFSRRDAAKERTAHLAAEYREGFGEDTIDRFLRAQDSLTLAEGAFNQSVVEYNKALMNFFYFKGTLLQHNNVHLMEGGWVPQAYQQALARAWSRSHALTPADADRPASPQAFASAIPTGEVGFARMDLMLKDEVSIEKLDPTAAEPKIKMPETPMPAAPQNPPKKEAPKVISTDAYFKQKINRHNKQFAQPVSYTTNGPEKSAKANADPYASVGGVMWKPKWVDQKNK